MAIYENGIVPTLMRIWPCLAAGTVNLEGELAVGENSLATLVYLAMDGTLQFSLSLAFARSSVLTQLRGNTANVRPLLKEAVGTDIFIKYELESVHESLSQDCRKILSAFGDTTNFGASACLLQLSNQASKRSSH